MKPDIERMYRSLSSLRYTRRFNGYPCASPQNVAEHSYYAALIAGALCTTLEAAGIKIDRCGAIEAALWHDAAEGYTGDVPHGFKRSTQELFEAWEQAEDKVLGRVAEFCGPMPWPLGEPDSLEGAVAKLSDWIELIFYVQSEAAQGNRVKDVTAERIWALLERHMALKFARLENEGRASGLIKWYADLLDYLRQAIGVPKNSSLRYDPLGTLEEGRSV